ncbi:MFS transporter [Oceanimonas sp. CHS3-5]|uniref:MFS transporter n=1 Tax=Oceanimonas sp. CHS3-5 TaxID=3068186 RepID=UPI00273EBC03|nr:MFS transporter [Oceanimonas sp. CHS3-5]MDP5292432.1 MFS transporter [Oceanimonas sp. CHS3-5]
MNQIVSHGFGMFLFAALVPLMRDAIHLSHWHLAAIGALTQLAYLAGAMLLGVLGPRLGTARLSLATGSLSTALLFTMAQLETPWLIMLALTCLAASAAISWGAIVEIISRHAQPGQRSTALSAASSGTAWGYGLNGLLILLVVPVLGWQQAWQLAGITGLLVLVLTWRLLNSLKKPAVATADPEPSIPASRLLATICRERTAFLACLICFLAGFTTMPFSSWLNTYLDQQGLAASLGGYTWTTVGLTGMVAGLLTGRLADRKGHGVALLVIFSGFALGLLAFVYDPARFALVAGFGYGLMYFPMWGILAGWLSKTYSATATMQISGACMVTFGLGGTLGNLLAGYLRAATGSLDAVFMTLAGAALVLVMVGAWIQGQRPTMAPPVTAVPEVPLP